MASRRHEVETFKGTYGRGIERKVARSLAFPNCAKFFPFVWDGPSWPSDTGNFI